MADLVEDEQQALDAGRHGNFLEDNRLDIVKPEAPRHRNRQSLEATSGDRFKSAVRLDNGDRVPLRRQTNATAGINGNLSIPERIGLTMPVFVNGPEADIEAWFATTSAPARSSSATS